jgi:beta-phosphoglucomutase
MSREELFMMEGRGVKAVANEISRKYNLPLDRTDEIIKDKQNHYNNIKRIRFYPNLLDVLNWAKEKNLSMAVVTGGNRERVMDTIENFGLTTYFQTVITSDDVSQTKPSAEPYLLAALRLEISPEDCVVIENAPLGIRSGKAAGMKVVGVTTTLQPHYLKEADVVVGDFIELLAALKRLY